MGTITQFAASVANDGIVASSGWFSGTQVTAKVYINSIFAKMNIIDALNPGMMPWQRFRMSVTNGTIIQNNIVEVALKSYGVASTSTLPTGFVKGVNPDNGSPLPDGQIALEMVGGCGSNTFEYKGGSLAGLPTQQDVMNFMHGVVNVLLNNTVLTGTAKVNVTMDSIVNTTSPYHPFTASIMFISYHVPEYFYLNKNDVLKVHGNTGDARLLFTVVTE